MGVDVHGKLLGKVSVEDVYAFILQEIDPNATIDLKTLGKKRYGKLEDLDFEFERRDDSEYWEMTSGFIFLTSKNGNKRMLFYCYDNINSFENLEYYRKLGLEDMVKAETTFISLGHNEEAVDIIKSIVTHFGGWLDENDCDDEPYYFISSNPVGEVKPVIHVTMQDIYDKFGGHVIIDK